METEVTLIERLVVEFVPFLCVIGLIGLAWVASVGRGREGE